MPDGCGHTSIRPLGGVRGYGTPAHPNTARRARQELGPHKKGGMDREDREAAIEDETCEAGRRPRALPARSATTARGHVHRGMGTQVAPAPQAW